MTSSLTLITGFAVFAAIRRTPAFDKRLVFAGYRQPTLIAAKTAAIASVAGYTAAGLLVFWRPGLAGWLAIAAAFAVIALTYGAFGLLLGVLVKGDQKASFLIIMGSLMDTSCRTRSATHRQQADPGMVPRLRLHAVRGRRGLRQAAVCSGG